MKISTRFAAVAATGVLTVGTMVLGGATQAQALDSPSCTGTNFPPAGTMCIHTSTYGQWHWWGPWSACQVYRPWEGSVITWVKSNQVGNVYSTYYDDGEMVGTRPAYFDGRPPGYINSTEQVANNVKVC